MTKNDLAAQIAKITGRHQTEVKQIVQLVINGIIEAIVAEERLELRNFGVFEVKHRKARKARNPKTDEVVIVPERSSITFRPGKFMKDRVNGLVGPMPIDYDDEPAAPADDPAAAPDAPDVPAAPAEAGPPAAE